VQAGRGEWEALERTRTRANELLETANVEFAAPAPTARAIALRALGRDAEALEAALPIALGGPEIANEDRRDAFLEAGLAALALEEEATVQRMIAFVRDLPPVMRSPLLRSAAARFEGRLAARGGDTRAAEERLTAAARELETTEAPFNLAQV